MDRLKTFGKYLIIVILFWILSDILIYFGINSTYKDMKMIGELPHGIEIVQMQSTKVNGRIKLNVTNTGLTGKYLKIDLYSSIGNNLGTQYIEIGEIKQNETKTIETYFKISEVKSYEVTVVDEAQESTKGFMDTSMKAMTVLVILIKLMFV